MYFYGFSGEVTSVHMDIICSAWERNKCYHSNLQSKLREPHTVLDIYSLSVPKKSIF